MQQTGGEFMPSEESSDANRPTWPQLTATESAAVRALLIYGPLSRVEIARQLQLTRANLTHVTRKLIELGLIFEGDQELRGRTGRPSGMLHIKQNSHRFLGVKLTGEMLFATVTDLEANMLASLEIPLPSQDFAIVVDLVAKTCRNLEKETGKVTAAGVSLAGDVVHVGGRPIVQHSAFLGWNMVPLGPELESLLKIPVAVQNDVRALTLGEHWFGAGAGHSSVVVVTVGVGVGLGLVHNNQLIEGAHGVAGRGDHMLIDTTGPICNLGHRGCASAFLTSSALLRAAGAPGETFDELVSRARAGDLSALRAFKDAASALGQFIAQISDIFDPEIVIVTGDGIAVAELGEDEIYAKLRLYRPGTESNVSLAIEPFEFSEWARGSAVAAIRSVLLT